jgi:hypothetical protein
MASGHCSTSMQYTATAFGEVVSATKKRCPRGTLHSIPRAQDPDGSVWYHQKTMLYKIFSASPFGHISPDDIRHDAIATTPPRIMTEHCTRTGKESPLSRMLVLLLTAYEDCTWLVQFIQKRLIQLSYSNFGVCLVSFYVPITHSGVQK